MRLTILGSGTSHGIPMIACTCAGCTASDPRDRRTRTSALFSYDDRHVLIDTAPELRLQCLACGVTSVHAVCFTHAHADHVVGLDDLRIFNDRLRTPLEVHADAATLAHLRRMFAYAFRDDPEYPSAKPHLRGVEVHGPFELFGRRVIPIPYRHGRLTVLGYRIGDIAYCPDCGHMPEESRQLLRDLDVLVLGAVRRAPHPTHFNLAQAVAEAGRIGARRTYFTHMAHDLGHAATSRELPAGIELACDGLVIEAGQERGGVVT